MEIAEWTVWGFAAFWTLQWSLAFRRRVGERKAFLISATTIPLLWIMCLIVVPALGYSPFHLLWIFPLCCVLRILPPFFPLSLLGYPGLLYGRLCCIGLQVRQELMEQEARELVDDIFDLLKKQYRSGLRGATASRRGRKAWVQTLDKDDVVRLQNLLAAKGTKWRNWEYKLHSGNIIIYSPVTPWGHETSKYDHSKPRMVKHLRVVPEPDGPFQLEYMRHTGRWCPIDVCVGDLQTIADFIEDDPFGLCHPKDPPDAHELRLKYHPPAG